MQGGRAGRERETEREGVGQGCVCEWWRGMEGREGGLVRVAVSVGGWVDVCVYKSLMHMSLCVLHFSLLCFPFGSYLVIKCYCCWFCTVRRTRAVSLSLANRLNIGMTNDRTPSLKGIICLGSLEGY